MIHGRLLDQNSGRCLVSRVLRTSSALERMRGLLGRSPLKRDEALLLIPCNAVHTFAMGYALDLIYLDRDWTIRKRVDNIAPWRLSACLGAGMVLEMPAGRSHELELNSGQSLCWES